MTETNQFRYSAHDEAVARAIAVKPSGGMSTEERWVSETRATLDLLIPLIPFGGRVLDFGTGPGRLIHPLLSARRDISVVAVDASSEMLEHAKATLSESEISRVRFALVDGPVSLARAAPPGSVDVAVGLYVLQHISEEDVRETVRVLKESLRPGGALFVINLFERSVPIPTPQETAATGATDRDVAIRAVATDAVAHGAAWKADSIDLLGELRAQFSSVHPLSLLDSGFPPRLASRHFGVICRSGATTATESARYLHDKYERLAAHEDLLVDQRTAFFVAITSVIAAVVYFALSSQGTSPLFWRVLLLSSAGMSTLSVFWLFTVERTIHSQRLFRDHAKTIERLWPLADSPIARSTSGPYLSQPFSAHQIEFLERRDGRPNLRLLHSLPPSVLWSRLPWVFLVLGGIGVGFAILHHGYAGW